MSKTFKRSRRFFDDEYNEAAVRDSNSTKFNKRQQQRKKKFDDADSSFEHISTYDGEFSRTYD